MAILKVGVIGLGMGRNHVSGFNKCKHSKVTAIADTSEERLKKIGEANKVPNRYTDPIEMLKNEDLDIVGIATPNTFHKPLTIATLKSGAHVFCEKPMAMNTTEAKQMQTAAKKAGKRIMINFSYRFSPATWALKKEVNKGSLGDVYWGNTYWLRRDGMPGFGGWFGTKALAGGGPLIDLGVHRLDLALWLMGHPEAEYALANTFDHLAKARAKKEKKHFDVEDLASGVIKFKNGAILQISASWASHIAEGEFMGTRLLGTKGGMIQRNVKGTYEFEAELYYETKAGKKREKKLNTNAKAPSPYAHFATCIAEKKPHMGDASEGLAVMKVLDALYKSAETGKPVKIT